MSSRARDAFSPSSNGSADHRDSSDDLDDEITEDQAVLSMFAPTFYLGNTIRYYNSRGGGKRAYNDLVRDLMHGAPQTAF
ncbi:hypothetical protein M408DRAFT_113967 [Serendipita vermifera MAFF 305830]|uniref:Uncharacterized protein n=1 Tax=Serendipita vermifera MAFF 305830 TaxID=933852 RepID=A0A0C2XKA0_SERVB|nr:hypothetical protein M408DRAFT_113967 [Serendipita vermifera MAFF 305830]